MAFPTFTDAQGNRTVGRLQGGRIQHTQMNDRAKQRVLTQENRRAAAIAPNLAQDATMGTAMGMTVPQMQQYQLQNRAANANIGLTQSQAGLNQDKGYGFRATADAAMLEQRNAPQIAYTEYMGQRDRGLAAAEQQAEMGRFVSQNNLDASRYTADQNLAGVQAQVGGSVNVANIEADTQRAVAALRAGQADTVDLATLQKINSDLTILGENADPEIVRQVQAAIAQKLGQQGGGGSQGGMVTVSNGSETLQIPAEDLQSAMADGYQQVRK
jgi:hypothetical protein